MKFFFSKICTTVEQKKSFELNQGKWLCRRSQEHSLLVSQNKLSGQILDCFYAILLTYIQYIYMLDLYIFRFSCDECYYFYYYYLNYALQKLESTLVNTHCPVLNIHNETILFAEAMTFQWIISHSQVCYHYVISIGYLVFQYGILHISLSFHYAMSCGNPLDSVDNKGSF